MGKSTISMAMFDSYVKLPEGSHCFFDEPAKIGIRHHHLKGFTFNWVNLC